MIGDEPITTSLNEEQKQAIDRAWHDLWAILGPTLGKLVSHGQWRRCGEVLVRMLESQVSSLTQERDALSTQLDYIVACQDDKTQNPGDEMLVLRAERDALKGALVEAINELRRLGHKAQGRAKKGFAPALFRIADAAFEALRRANPLALSPSGDGAGEGKGHDRTR